MKRINLLYVFWLLAFVVFIWVLNSLRNQSFRTVFGTAATESYSLNVDYSATVSERRVQPGDHVKKGDTLLVLLRNEINKDISDMQSMLLQADVDRMAKNSILDKDEAVFLAQQNSRKSEIEAQIKSVEKEIEIQNNLRNSLGQKPNSANNLKELELAALKESLKQLNNQLVQQHNSYEVQRDANNKNFEAKASYYKNDISYFQTEQYKMTVVSPCDGIVEGVFVLPKDITPQYKELVRLNSASPNRVTGFIQESMFIPFHIGDSVTLTSAARPAFISKGLIIGSGNNLVEMPLRLRKFIDLRVWGRELFIKLDPSNDFYIDEKIIIQVK